MKPTPVAWLAFLCAVSAIAQPGGIRDQGFADYARRNPPRDSTGLVPLTDLGKSLYLGQQGGLYPNGENEPPSGHLDAGIAIARGIGPLDGAGNPSAQGNIVLLSVGMSNTSQESQAFEKLFTAETGKNPLVRFVNGSQGGQTAEKIMDPAAPFWNVITQRLAAANATPAQVQVVWLKQANIAPTKPFPQEAKKLESDLVKVLHVMRARYPNLKMVYFSSRIYGGYARSALNPEPHAYESGFAPKWIIASQISGSAELNYDAVRGPVRAPWLAWGPYLWADGVKARKDGLTYLRADLRPDDGTHPSAEGTEKVARQLLQFFKTDRTARLWFTPRAATSKLRIRVTGEKAEPIWARLEVYGPDGKKRQPPGAVLDARSKIVKEEPGYRSSFVVKGEFEIEAEPGNYKIIAEHGLEFERVERTIEVRDQPVTADIRLRPWVNARSLGWWSGDMHIHRPPDQVEALALAEDVNLSVVFTMWNRQNLWAGKELPKDPVTRISPNHLATLANAEDERGGGAWMLHRISAQLPLAATNRWDPPGIRFVRTARESRAAGEIFPWFDSEKLIWWETPVMMALETPDSAGVLHNHFNQYGMMDMEAWGRARDRKRFPGHEGFVEYSNSLYYRYLNLGFRLPATAGSATGVLPNPAGYNRTYVELKGKPFTVENWYRGLKDGRSFVSNGPLLFFDVKRTGTALRGSVEVLAHAPIDRVEIVANGEVIKSFTPSGAMKWQSKFTVDAKNYSWVVARCFVGNPLTVRMAHTSPVYLPGKWDARADAQYFVDWIDELVAESRRDPKRFAGAAERDEVLKLYDRARAFYAGRAAGGE